MAKQVKSSATQRETATETSGSARILPIMERGISTSRDFAQCMSAMMSDLATSRLAPQVSNAMCNAAGKLLKIIEMEYKYGKQVDAQGKRLLSLVAAE